MRRCGILLAWTVAAIAVLAAACARPDSAARTAHQPPQIVFADTAHDFGTVRQGAPVTHAYTFRNAGGLDLRVDNVRTSCGCTAAIASPGVIPPGREGTIQATFDTADYFGRTTRTISVYANDPAQPVTLLTLVGDIEVGVAADPPQLYVGRLRRGQAAVFGVRVVLGQQTAVAPGSIAATENVVTAKWVRGAAGKGERQLRVAIKEDAPLGRFTDSLTVGTTGSGRRRLTIPVAGVVEGDVVVSPVALHFGTVVAGAGVSRLLALRNHGAQPVQVTAAKLSPAVGQAQVDTLRDGQEYHVRVALHDELEAGGLRGTLELHTDHPEQPLIAVPFSGRVVAQK